MIEIPVLKNPLLNIFENTSGRDFFVGDIHGHYQTFQKGLHQLNFDTNRDRVFAVGDLIDRGPDSLSCLRLLNNKWFFSVIGNHEQMLLKRKATGNKKINITTRWQNELSDSELEECCALIHKMSFAITINNSHNTIGIIHAGIPFNYTWNKFLNKLCGFNKDAVLFSLYDRSICHQTQHIPDIDYIFVGHQGLEQVKWFGNQVCIDTAVFIENWPGETYGLTFSWLENGIPKFLTIPQ